MVIETIEINIKAKIWSQDTWTAPYNQSIEEYKNIPIDQFWVLQYIKIVIQEYLDIVFEGEFINWIIWKD